MKDVWLKNEVFSWEPNSQWITYPNREKLTRAYTLWSHAESLLAKRSSEFHLTDAISTLKRCLNQRLKLIEETYNLRKIDPHNSQKGYLELLESYSLVRPLMLKKLMSIRNNIEHKDARPPSRGRCQELLDLTWYFLKSTDSILKTQFDTLEYRLIDVTGEDTPYGYSIRIDLQHKQAIEISGWFPKQMVFTLDTKSSTRIKTKTIYTKEERWSECSNHHDKCNDDIWLIGKLQPSKEIKHMIFKTILNSY